MKIEARKPESCKNVHSPSETERNLDGTGEITAAHVS
jgi:hypothetical protein